MNLDKYYRLTITELTANRHNLVVQNHLAKIKRLTMRQPSSFLLYLFLLINLVLLSACSGNESQQSEPSQAESVIAKELSNNSDSINCSALTKDELNRLYRKAINDFMHLVYQKDQLVFDTLFLGEREFGTEDDFPEIDLPKQIGNTGVRMVSVGEAHGAYKHRFKKTSPFINLMGWANKSNAEFIFICFYPEFKHQYDVYLNYVYAPIKKEFELEEERFEVLMDAKGNQAPHFAIYKQGKFVGDKAIQ